MEIVGIAAVVMAAAFVVLVACIIPAFIEIRKTAQTLREFILHTDNELKPILRDLTVAVTDLKTIAEGAADRVDDVKELMGAMGDTGRGLRTINSVVGSVAGALARSSIWVSGAKVASSFILNRFTKKRG
jgi:uncharacterized protein YoxC